MTKIYAFLPIDALAKFSIDKPPDWDEMSYEDKVIYFFNCADESYQLCSACKGSLILAREFNLDENRLVIFEESN